MSREVAVCCSLYCSCEWCMFTNFRERTIYCVNENCPEYNKKYKLPTITLEEA